MEGRDRVVRKTVSSQRVSGREPGPSPSQCVRYRGRTSEESLCAAGGPQIHSPSEFAGDPVDMPARQAPRLISIEEQIGCLSSFPGRVVSQHSDGDGRTG